MGVAAATCKCCVSLTVYWYHRLPAAPPVHLMPADSHNKPTDKAARAGQSDNPIDDDCDEGMALFRKAVGDVKPVPNDRAASTRKPPPPRPRKLELDEQRVMHDAMHEGREPDDRDFGEHLSWCRSGVQKRVLKKLRGGYYAIQAELDLHGLTTSEAKAAMQAFIIKTSLERGSCCVRIIHGKGHKSATDAPVLKPFTAGFLRGRRDVLAYTSARPADGGGGALYVLLRSSVRTDQ